MGRSKAKAAAPKAAEPSENMAAGGEPVTAVNATTCVMLRPLPTDEWQVVATTPALDDLLSQLQPEVRKVVLGTPLATDAKHLRQLVTFRTNDQDQIVRQIDLGIAWDGAVERFLPNTVAKSAIAGELSSIVEVDLDGLTPNTVNGSVFSESLTDESVVTIAEDLERRGMRVPVEVLRTGVILDGERRFRAARRRGEKSIRVRIVADDMSDTEVRAYIFDAHSTTRDASLVERLNFFKLGVDVLRQRHGIPTGMHMVSSNEETMTGPEIRETAAKRAGLGSAEKARRASKVLVLGDDVTKAAMLAGTVSINAAYATLGPKHGTTPETADADGSGENASTLVPASPPIARDPRSQGARTLATESGAPSEIAEATAVANPLQGRAVQGLQNTNSSNGASPSARPSGGRKGRSGSVDGHETDSETTPSHADQSAVTTEEIDLNVAEDHFQRQTATAGQRTSRSASEDRVEQTEEEPMKAALIEQALEEDETDGVDALDYGPSDEGQIEDVDALDTADAIETLCSEVTRLADADYDEARQFVEETVAALWEALGSPPEPEDNQDDEESSSSDELDLGSLLDGV